MVLVFYVSSYVALHFLQGFIQETIWNHFQVIQRVQVFNWNHYLQCQRVATWKAGNSEMVLVFCTSYHSDIHWPKTLKISLTVFKLQNRPIYYRNHHFQCSKGHNSKSRLNRSIDSVFCTVSHDNLHLCEVLSKYLKLPELTPVHGRNGYFQYLQCSKVVTPK